MGARPRIRSPENAELICTRIVDGLNLREIGKELDCTAGAIVHWVAEDVEFAKRYARAKEAQTEIMAADILAISDDGTNDWMERASGSGELEAVVRSEHIQRSRLRVDSRRWLMSKMMPKVYGDSVLQKHSGADGTGPIEIAVLTPEERQAKIKVMIEDAFAPLPALPLLGMREPEPHDGQDDGLAPVEDDKG